jgi:hypothetical protein
VKETPGVLFVLLGRDGCAGRRSSRSGRRCWISTGSARSRPRTRRSTCSTCRWRSRDPGADGRGAKGLPFYLELQVDLYESLKNQGRAPGAGAVRRERARDSGPLPRPPGRGGVPGARRAGALPAVRRGAVAAPRAGVHGRAAAVRVRRVAGVLVRRGAGEGVAQPARADARALCERRPEGEPVLHERVHRCLFAWWDERCRPRDVARSRRGTSWRWKKRRSIAPPSRARRSATGRVSAGHYSHGLPNTDRANTLGIGARDRRDDAAGG